MKDKSTDRTTIGKPASGTTTAGRTNTSALFLTVIAVFALVLSACNTRTRRHPVSSNAGDPDNLVLISGGAFVMGSPPDEPDRIGSGDGAETLHKAAVSSFYISKYPVTQAQYTMIMGANPSFFQEARLPIGINNGDDLPVEQVSWFEAIDFCNRLSQREMLEPVYSVVVTGRGIDGNVVLADVDADWTKNGYRLPTEAEWEYACRGEYPNKAEETSAHAFGIGDGFRLTKALANFNIQYPYDAARGGQSNNTAGKNYAGQTSLVGRFEPNNYGLYDMHGNVWEWCWDEFGPYPGSGLTDYRGLAVGAGKVMRGGSWVSGGRHLRSAYRGNYPPSYRGNSRGFRIVRSNFSA